MSGPEFNAYQRNPAKGSRFMGQAVHRATAAELRAQGWDVTYSSNRGADFTFGTGQVVELTTPAQLAAHIAKYGTDLVTYATYSVTP